MPNIAPLSFRAATTLSSQRIVAADQTLSRTCKLPDTTTAQLIGITVDENSDTTTAIAVAGPGAIAKLQFISTVSAGALVGTNASGQGVAFAAVTASARYIGVLIGAPTEAVTNSVHDVLIMPGQHSTE